MFRMLCVTKLIVRQSACATWSIYLFFSSKLSNMREYVSKLVLKQWLVRYFQVKVAHASMQNLKKPIGWRFKFVKKASNETM